MHSLDINLENISKIEGHANLTVKVRHNEVKYAKLIIAEKKRYYEEIVIGKNFLTAPSVLSRICGTCSIAHLTTAIEAVEKGLNLRASAQTLRMRRLLHNAMFIRDHILHLYFFALPDYLGVRSALDFEGELHKYLHDALDLKKSGNDLCNLIAGKTVHPLIPRVGGFSKIPVQKEVEKTIHSLEHARDVALRTVELFDGFSAEFERPTCYVGLVNRNYTFLEGEVRDTCGLCIPESNYMQHFREFVIPYSTAEGFKHDGRDYMVGALARINLNKPALHEKTRKDAKKALRKFPAYSPFLNNLAQAVEVLHCIDLSLEMLGKGFRDEKAIAIKPRKCEGIGVTEAPRGTLYHQLSINERGVVKDARIVIPTAQNAYNIEQDIKQMVPELLKQGMDRKQIKTELEKLIRAYDPCMSCATHFLKIKWI